MKQLVTHRQDKPWENSTEIAGEWQNCPLCRGCYYMPSY